MIKREQYLEVIRPFYNSRVIKVLTGMRRAGKSIILQQIHDEISELQVSKDTIHFISLEDYKNKELLNSDNLHSFLESKIADKAMVYFLIDEIQLVQDFEKVINSIYSKYNVSIFLTGSNGKLLSGELATLLSGRYVQFLIKPLSFPEFSELSKGAFGSLDDCFANYLTWGGLPGRFSEIVDPMSEAEIGRYVSSVYDSIILRDIVQRTKASDVALLDNFIQYLVSINGQYFSADKVLGFLASRKIKVSRDTIYTYYDAIVNSQLFSSVSRYDISGKELLSKRDKIYVTDLGIKRFLKVGNRPDYGSALESIVYNELIARGNKVYVGKLYNGEIDFVIVTPENEINYMQVAYLLADEDVVAREFGAFRPIKDNNPKIVLSMDKFDFSQDGIKHMNIVDWLMKRRASSDN